MIPIVRSVLAIFFGMLSTFFLILMIQMLGENLYPPPPWLDIKNPASIAEAIKVTPTGAFVIMLISCAVGTFIGAGIAARIAPIWKLGHGMIIGILFLVSSIGQMRMFPHPTWVWVIGVAEFLPVAFLGAWLNSGVISKDPTPEPEV